MASGIKQVYAMFNGQKVLASYDEATGFYIVETTAPATSSWGQPDHVYTMILHAEDVAGNSVSMDSTDPTYGDQLKFRVLEKSKPTATIVSPTENSVLGNSTINVSLKVVDAGDSGINLSSIVFKVDGTVEPVSGWTSGEDGAYTATVELAELSDGAHKLTLDVSDNDGNAATQAVTNFVISTAAPSLDLTTPANNLVTNSNKVVVSGTAVAGSYTTLAGVTVNGANVTVESDGTFSHEVTLTEGNNVITVVATDSIGKSTTVTRTVLLDTQAPIITDVSAVAVTVDASGKIKVTFKVTEQ